jgi:Uma2 family endonuclease
MAMATTEAAFVPLESGDRLSRAGFHRRYCARPDIKKAELVRGVVDVPSPVRHRDHGWQNGLMVLWLSAFAARHPELDVAVNSTVFMADDSEMQPDAALFRPPAAGAPAPGVRPREDGYLEGAPELNVEIAASSAAYDLYREVGVHEYIVWQVLERRIDWCRLREGRYRPLQPDAHGATEGEVFPGLRLDVTAMLAGDRARVRAALNPR